MVIFILHSYKAAIMLSFRKAAIPLLHRRCSFAYEQRLSLVNIKLKWVKDKTLDSVVAGERELKAVCELKDWIAVDPRGCLPIYHLSRRRRQLGLADVKVSTFMRRYPTIFQEFTVPSCSTPVRWFRLTDEALLLHQEELEVLRREEMGLIERLCKLLMLTGKRMTLPLQTIDQLKWDMGLPYDYPQTLIPRYAQFFKLIRLPDDRVGVKLLCWDDRLAVSKLQKNNDTTVASNDSLSFPIKFTRGFGLKRKCMSWLEEWQRLPYTSPYADASHIDPRTDISEKRNVGVFHELLHLMIQKKTDRKNVSNLRKPFGLPQKFTKVFGRHPGIFYISQKCATQTVLLREAYNSWRLLEKHPLVEIRERYASMMKTGLLNRSRGLYKVPNADHDGEDCRLLDISKHGFRSDGSKEDSDSESSSSCDLYSYYRL